MGSEMCEPYLPNEDGNTLQVSVDPRSTRPSDRNQPLPLLVQQAETMMKVQNKIKQLEGEIVSLKSAEREKSTKMRVSRVVDEQVEAIVQKEEEPEDSYIINVKEVFSESDESQASQQIRHRIEKISQENESEEKDDKEGHKLRQDKEDLVGSAIQELGLPHLLPAVQQSLKNNGLASDELPEGLARLKLTRAVYFGRAEGDQPSGKGEIYYNDGTYFSGIFRKGKAHGQGVRVFSDGSYYKGGFENGHAHDQYGLFRSKSMTYKGGFRNDVFSGAGKEQGEGYVFEGDFAEGRRLKGELKWKDKNGFEFIYRGTFNEQNKFQGNGVLAEAKGVYRGQFKAGLKEGKGIFEGNNGIRYEGEYKAGKKQGVGLVRNSDGKVAYKGEMRDNLPHGQGKVYSEDHGQMTYLQDGIDCRLLLESLKPKQ